MEGRVYGEKKKNWGIREREWEREIRERERVAGRGGRINEQDVNLCTQSPNSGSG